MASAARVEDGGTGDEAPPPTTMVPAPTPSSRPDAPEPAATTTTGDCALLHVLEFESSECLSTHTWCVVCKFTLSSCAARATRVNPDDVVKACLDNPLVTTLIVDNGTIHERHLHFKLQRSHESVRLTWMPLAHAATTDSLLGFSTWRAVGRCKWEGARSCFAPIHIPATSGARW